MQDVIEIPNEVAIVVRQYKEDYKELQRRKDANEPSIDHWRLNANVKSAEATILEFIRTLDL